MSFKAFEQGANVVSLIKGDSFYAMTCAWAMHIDYEEVLMLLGSQSDTSKNIEAGDKIGKNDYNNTSNMITELC